ncbi:MAG TPA: alpha/beta hydrolase-fold protein [Bacteroidota bacterium]|nr:alpha/beta hydrolase-fold protein [Bacteroidota bacterium]
MKFLISHRTLRFSFGCMFFAFALSVPSASQECSVTLKVVVPRSTPADAKIFVAGNHPKLGDWDPGRIELLRENDSAWAITEIFPKGSQLEYKVTRGSWNKQAIYAEGVIPGNFRLTVSQDTAIVVRPISWSDSYVAVGKGITGNVKYHRSIMGEGLRYDRDVIVWLPPSYDKDELRRYPVLYMHDGQNVFDPSTSFIGYDWHVDEVADSLMRGEKIQEIIIVAVNNSPDRVPEYSDSELGRKYATFVVYQLKPFIDKTYRTKPDAANTGVMGSSMGGLSSFLFVWWYPDVFSKAGCLSSAFLFDDGKTLKEVDSYKGPGKNVRVYMDCGGAGMEARLKPGMDEMRRILLKKSYKEGVDFEYFYDENAEHIERAWAERVWRPLRFLFGK